MTSKKSYGLFKDTIAEYKQYYPVLQSLIDKNIKGKYKNTVIGCGWHLVIPLLLLIMYYLVFTQIRSATLPDYWLYLTAGLFPFNFMITNLLGSTTLISSNMGTIKKIYYPREFHVFSQLVSSGITLLIGLILMVALILITGHPIDIVCFLFSTVAVIIMVLFTLGLVLTVSTVSVYVKDLQHVISSVLIMFYFLTPMYFTTKELTGEICILIWCNPFTYYVEMMHDTLYYNTLPDSFVILISIGLCVLFLLLGVLLFNKYKKNFAEVA